jgi:hypothetical protein
MEDEVSSRDLAYRVNGNLPGRRADRLGYNASNTQPPQFAMPIIASWHRFLQQKHFWLATVNPQPN